MSLCAFLCGLGSPAWSLLPSGESKFIKLEATPSRESSSSVAARSVAVDTIQSIETQHFFIVFSVTGIHRLVPNNGDLSANAPQSIDKIAEFAENSWRIAIDTMGYKPPPMNAESTWFYREPIPKGKVPIEIVDMGAVSIAFREKPYMGYAVSPSDNNSSGVSQILIENDFLYDSAGVKKPIRVYMNRGLGADSLLYDYSHLNAMWDGWNTAIAHNFFHCVQMSYENNLDYAYAFRDMTAAWFAMRATLNYGSVHHWGSNQRFLNSSNGGLFTAGDIADANALIIRALAKYAGDQIVRKLWEWRSNNLTELALLPERIWFRKTAVSLGLDLYGFLDYFTSEVGCMYVNAQCDLNDYGGFRSVLPNIKYINATIRDTVPPLEALAPNGWGTDLRGLGSVTLSSGYSRFRIEKGNDTVPHSGFVLHLPGRTFTPFSLRNGPAVVEKKSTDTLLVFFGFSGGVRGSGLGIYPTNAPVTPSGVKRRSTVPAGIKAIYDFRGRRVKDKETSGITYVRDMDGVIHRSIQWRK